MCIEHLVRDARLFVGVTTERQLSIAQKAAKRWDVDGFPFGVHPAMIRTMLRARGTVIEELNCPCPILDRRRWPAAAGADRNVWTEQRARWFCARICHLQRRQISRSIDIVILGDFFEIHAFWRRGLFR